MKYFQKGNSEVNLSSWLGRNKFKGKISIYFLDIKLGRRIDKD